MEKLPIYSLQDCPPAYYTSFCWGTKGPFASNVLPYSTGEYLKIPLLCTPIDYPLERDAPSSISAHSTFSSRKKHFPVFLRPCELEVTDHVSGRIFNSWVQFPSLPLPLEFPSFSQGSPHRYLTFCSACLVPYILCGFSARPYGIRM